MPSSSSQVSSLSSLPSLPASSYLLHQVRSPARLLFSVKDSAPFQSTPQHAIDCSSLSPATHALHQRVTQRLAALHCQASAADMVESHDPAAAQSLKPSTPGSSGPVLLTNLRVFDGIHLTLRDDVQILIDDGKIIDMQAVNTPVSDVSQTIDCQGKAVIPGLIDAHWHSMFCGLHELVAMTADVGYVHLVAAQQARMTLMRGFTSVRRYWRTRVCAQAWN